jgi:hypothetical protein
MARRYYGNNLFDQPPIDDLAVVVLQAYAKAAIDGEHVDSLYKRLQSGEVVLT